MATYTNIHSINTLAVAEAIVQRREFTAMTFSNGTPTLQLVRAFDMLREADMSPVWNSEGYLIANVWGNSSTHGKQRYPEIVRNMDQARHLIAACN